MGPLACIVREMIIIQFAVLLYMRVCLYCPCSYPCPLPLPYPHRPYPCLYLHLLPLPYLRCPYPCVSAPAPAPAPAPALPAPHISTCALAGARTHARAGACTVHTGADAHCSFSLCLSACRHARAHLLSSSSHTCRRRPRMSVIIILACLSSCSSVPVIVLERACRHCPRVSVVVVLARLLSSCICRHRPRALSSLRVCRHCPCAPVVVLLPT
jgi:hypothetical protein